MAFRLKYKPQQVVATCADCFVVTAYSGGQRFKLFQVIFAKDGSLFVQFPYFDHQVGIVAAVTIPGTGSDSAILDLAASGKATSHLVKYSHHLSDEAHFSQDGKVIASVRRQSIPLAEYSGHLFTAYAQRPASFRTATQKDNKETTVRKPITFRPVRATNLRFAGFWYRKEELWTSKFTEIYGPEVTASSPDGAENPAG